MNSLRQLWLEEQGAIVSAEIMLVASILVIPMIVGLKSVRDSVLTELGDVAQALANVNQSFSFSGAAGHHAFVGGGAFTDIRDFCDTDAPDCEQHSKCITICSALVVPAGTDGVGTP